MDNPLLVGVTRNLAALYAPWWQEVRIKGALFALLALTSVIGLANRFRQLRLLSRSAAIHAEQMQASATRYAKVMATVKDAIHIVDPQGRLIDWNPAFLAHLGYDAEEARGLRVEDWDALIPAGDIPERIMALSKSGGVFQTLHRRKDGKVLDVELSATGIMLDGRSLLLASARDMTERKQAELEREQMKTEVEQLQKLESLGRLAGGVAHDMNNVLGAILALSSAHLAILPKDNPLYPSLETMRDAATRGGDMVKRLLTFSRHTPKEKRELNLNDLLLEQARLLERTTLAKVHLDMDLAPDLHPTLGDGSALTHALMNLCVNAVDAMDDGGTLTFRTRNLGVDQIEVTVEDNGCGMTKEVLDRAMDPFFTTKGVGKGTGLGLSLVFTTVHAHGGQLKIQSEPGRGTQVTMTFPSTVSLSLEPGQEVPVRMVMAGHPLQVLLVDDDELIQKSTRMLVEVLGHSVTTCVSGEATIELLEQGFRPDAVILDMNMPGMGGKGTLPRLRRLFPTVPVLLATGRADQEAMDLVAAHPFVTLLSKPFSFEELRGHLHQVAGGRPTVQNS